MVLAPPSRFCVTCVVSQTIVVSSIFGELYSDDAGKSFKPSTGGGTSQSVRYIGVNGDGGLKFGVTGQYGAVNGVSPRMPLGFFPGNGLSIVLVQALVSLWTAVPRSRRLMLS